MIDKTRKQFILWFMKATITDIAKKVGCSKTSVSFAFNNPTRVSKQTYDKIMQAAKELGYVPNPVARILAMKKTQTIGFLLTQPIENAFGNLYISEIIRGIGSVCNENNLMLSVLSPFNNNITNAIQQACVDGIIIIGLLKGNMLHQQLIKRQMPYVTIDAEFQHDYLNVGIDEKETAEKLMDLFIQKGHRHICICTLDEISENLDKCSFTMDYRLKGIMQSVEKYQNISGEKIELTYCFIPPNPEDAISKAKQVLSASNRPTAVYCMADLQALPFYSAAALLNLKIPEDLSIAGFDNLPISKLLVPPMTIVDQPGFKKGVEAASLLIRCIEGKQCSSVYIESEIEERGSTARAYSSSDK